MSLNQVREMIREAQLVLLDTDQNADKSEMNDSIDIVVAQLQAVLDFTGDDLEG